MDPLNPQSLNRYAYTLNNPISIADPSGLDVVAIGNCYFQRINYYVDGEYQGTDVYFIGCAGGGGGGGGGGRSPDVGGGGGGGGNRTPSSTTPTQPSKSCFVPSHAQNTAISILRPAASFWNRSLGVGLGASAGVGFGKGIGIYGGASAQLVVTPAGAAGLQVTFTAPAALTGHGTYGLVTLQSAGAGYLGGAQFSFSNAQNLSQMGGPAVDVSGSMAAGLGIGGDVAFGEGGVYQATTTIGFGAGGRGGAGAVTNSWVIPSCTQ